MHMQVHKYPDTYVFANSVRTSWEFITLFYIAPTLFLDYIGWYYVQIINDKVVVKIDKLKRVRVRIGYEDVEMINILFP